MDDFEVRLGGERYAEYGIERSKGTLAFQLAGNVKRGQRSVPETRMWPGIHSRSVAVDGWRRG